MTTAELNASMFLMFTKAFADNHNQKIIYLSTSLTVASFNTKTLQTPSECSLSSRFYRKCPTLNITNMSQRPVNFIFSIITYSTQTILLNIKKTTIPPNSCTSCQKKLWSAGRTTSFES
jgi:hypothetical protein